MKRCNCNSGECINCFKDMMDEEPQTLFCKCMHPSCAVCDYFLTMPYGESFKKFMIKNNLRTIDELNEYTIDELNGYIKELLCYKLLLNIYYISVTDSILNNDFLKYNVQVKKLIDSKLINDIKEI